MKTSDMWLIDEAKSVDPGDLRQISRELPSSLDVLLRAAQDTPMLAATLHDVVIHDNRKWFGGADIRVDTLMLHGNGTPEDSEGWYSSSTMRFGRVGDGERLPIDAESGGLLFYGRPQHFLSMFVTVSRDTKDTDDLAQLLKTELHDSAEMKAAMTTMMALAVAAPQAAIVVGAIQASALIGDLAYRALRAMTSKTVGLYHASWLQHRDAFGVGRHPGAGSSYRVKDLSFWYQVVVEDTHSAVGP